MLAADKAILTLMYRKNRGCIGTQKITMKFYKRKEKDFAKILKGKTISGKTINHKSPGGRNAY